MAEVAAFFESIAPAQTRQTKHGITRNIAIDVKSGGLWDALLHYAEQEAIAVGKE